MGHIPSIPSFWDQVIAAAQARGHEVICISNRAWAPAADGPERIPRIPFIAVADTYKTDAAREAGYRVDVWRRRSGDITPPADFL